MYKTLYSPGSILKHGIGTQIDRNEINTREKPDIGADAHGNLWCRGGLFSERTWDR